MYLSTALDLDNLDQELSGALPITVVGNRILWEVNGWGDETNTSIIDPITKDIIIPVNGIYNFDIQLRVKNLVNVHKIELALYKTTEEDGSVLEDPDYWFILDEKTVESSTIVHLNACTQFDFRGQERYCVKVILHPITEDALSATIEGSDDYTAWGVSFQTAL